MKVLWVLGMIAGGVVLAGTALADPLPLDVSVVVKHSDNATKQSVGGVSGKDTITFQVDLHNKGMDDLSNIGIKLYVMSGPNLPYSAQMVGGSNSNDLRFKQGLNVVTVLSKAGITFPWTEDAHIQMGEAVFSARVSTASTETETTHTYSGTIYQGYAIAIYSGDKLTEVRTGNGAEEKAYKQYVKAHGDATPAGSVASDPAPSGT